MAIAGARKCSDVKTCLRYEPRTTDTQWRHKSKISEKMGRCGRQNMLPPYLKIWEWEWIFGRAVKAISSLDVRSPWYEPKLTCFIEAKNFELPRLLWLPLIWLIFTHLNLDSTDGSTICRCSIPGFIRHGIWVWIGHWIRHGQNGAKTWEENNCKGLFVEN